MIASENSERNLTRYRPGAARRYATRRWQFVAYRFVANQTIMDPKIAADLRVRTSLMAGGD